MDLYSAERLRKELFEDVIIEELSDDFEQSFLKLIEYCNFIMLESQDNFFALFFIQIKREINYSINAPITTLISGDNFVMHFNPSLILECNLNEIQALIKHEIYHIMSKHYERARILKKKYSDLAISLGMDISINQYIMYLPAWSVKLDTVKRTYNVILPEERTMEEYVALIQSAIDKFEKKPSEKEEWSIESHELWSEVDSQVDQIEEITKRVAGNATKGKLPESIELLLKAMKQVPEISWKDKLKKMLGILPAGHKKTITRKNRRQPNRLDLRGSLSNRIAKLVIAIDISGSVTDAEIHNIMVEILSIIRNYPFEITIIECDSVIQRVYKLKNIKDVKQKVNSKGGTKYSPVFEYIFEQRMRDYVLVYFTDGMGEKKLTIKPYNYKTLWVLTGKDTQLSLMEPNGEVINMNKAVDKKEKVDVYELIRQEMKDITVDWVAKGE